MGGGRHDSNESLTRFLNRYCDQKAPPGYAVMLCGPWGSGKTWFIDNYRQSLTKRTLYVSLFGASTISDIRNQFFAQIHPKLSNPTIQKAWSLTRALVRGTLKLDIYGDEKDDASLQISIPEIEKWASTEGAVLIFDDLERCGMSLNDALGFINQFVEHDGYRVIVLANEDAESLNQASGFPTIKEKVIGRTFRVRPDAESALKHFITEIDSEIARKLLESRTNLALDIFRRAQYDNLRQFRQGIFDFSALVNYLQLKQEQTSNKEFIDRLMEDVLTISIEHRAAVLTPADIRGLGEMDWARYVGQRSHDDKDKSESAKDRALQRHGFNDSVALALPASAFADFYENGSLSESTAADALKSSRYLADQYTPSWRRLWYLLDIKDDEFELLFDDVYRRFISLEYSDEGELLHVASMLLNISSIGLIDKTTAQIENAAQGVVRQLAKKGRIDVDGRRARHDSPMRHMSAYGLGFTAPNSKEFRNFCTYYLQHKDASRIKRTQERAREWMKLLPNDPDAWLGHLASSSSEESWFSDVSVFSFISAQKFAHLLQTLQAATMEKIRDAFEERYTYPSENTSWKIQELPFLKELEHIISVNLVKRKKRRLHVSDYYLDTRLMPMLAKSIASLEKFQAEQRAQPST